MTIRKTLGLLGGLLALSVFSLAPLSPAYAEGIDSVSPQEGPPGTVITVHGIGFNPNVTTDVWLGTSRYNNPPSHPTCGGDYRPPAEAQTQVTTDANGTFTAQITAVDLPQSTWAFNPPPDSTSVIVGIWASQPAPSTTSCVGTDWVLERNVTPPPDNRPAAPSNLKATVAGKSRNVRLTWNDNSTNETGFVVSLDSQVSRDVLGADRRTYTWTGLTPGEHCFWVASKIIAPTGNEQSDWVGPTCVTVPSK